MKATGIVRRIDDLGRIVVPKEIRRTLRIREGDPFEIFLAEDEGIVFKKYSPIKPIYDIAHHLCDAHFRTYGQILVITDRNKVIAASRDMLEDTPLSTDVIELMSKQNVWSSEDELYTYYLDSEDTYKVSTLVNLYIDGERYGSVILVQDSKEPDYDAEYKSVKCVANFLKSQLST